MSAEIAREMCPIEISTWHTIVRYNIIMISPGQIHILANTVDDSFFYLLASLIDNREFPIFL
jgi:hypothetical protein